MEKHLCVAGVPLFNHLPLEDQQVVDRYITHFKYKKGEEVFNPEDNKMIIIDQGRVKVYQLAVNGQEHLIRIDQIGDYEGEMRLLTNSAEDLYGKALEDTIICSLSKSDFDSLLLDYPQIAIRLLELNAQKMMQLEMKINYLSKEKIEARLALYLTDQIQKFGKNNFNLNMKMKDLATFLGTTPESLSRTWRLFEKNRIIERNKKQVKIIDKAQLNALLNNG